MKTENYTAKIRSGKYLIFKNENEYNQVAAVSLDSVYISNSSDYSKYEELAKLIEQCKINLSSLGLVEPK